MRMADGQSTLDKSSFDKIADLAHRECGLKIAPEKLMMVQSRLRHRLRALNLEDFNLYSSFVCSDDGFEERRVMISALTTNVSSFFREPHHFDILTTALLPSIRQRITSGQRIRIWSAGCSNGQEPYSIAMHLLRAEPALTQADFRILATDIDPKVVTFAKNATYPEQMLSGVKDQWRQDYFELHAGAFRVVDKVRRLVVFQELNLLAQWPMRHRFDAIFCRNVVIYFDTETQNRLWPRFNTALAQDGVFLLGHSERMATSSEMGFQSIGPTAYAKAGSKTVELAMASGGKNGTT